MVTETHGSGNGPEASRALRQSPGRPKDPAKRQAILKAATRLFLEKGFENTSVRDITEAAGVSRVTFYAHFGGKETLFQAAIQERCASMTGDDLFSAIRELPARQALETFGLRFLGLLETEESRRLTRLLMAQAPERPLMARLFYEAGPRRVQENLARTLESLAGREGLFIPDPLRAAAHFVCLVRGMHTFRREIGLEPGTPEDEKRAHVSDCVEFFLRACRP